MAGMAAFISLPHGKIAEATREVTFQRQSFHGRVCGGSGVVEKITVTHVSLALLVTYGKCSYIYGNVPPNV